MLAYEKLDAWKGCHALVLAVLDTLKEYAHQDDPLLNRIGHTAVRSAGGLAFGAGSRSRTMLRHAAEYAAGYLAELGYVLSLIRTAGILPHDTCAKLDALRGRAAFYTWHWIESLVLPPNAADGPSP